MIKKIVLFGCITMAVFSIMAQQTSFPGYWQGWLHYSDHDSLTIGMNIEQNGNSLHIELDSPDQYVTGIESSFLQLTDSTLIWRVPTLQASFKGKMAKDGLSMTGTFTQRSLSLPLTLHKGYERKTFARPQEPKPPYPYKDEEIKIKERDQKFALINGTLTCPTHPRALIILISGSGWQNRDEALFGHKPFLVIADYLSRQGYAVFRYDDFPPSIFAKSTTFDFKDGVKLILDSLLKRADLSTLPVGLIGHSEGSWVAFMTAAEDKRINFVVSLSGVGQTMREVLNYQIRAIYTADSPLTKIEIDSCAGISDALYEAVIRSSSPEKAVQTVSSQWDAFTAKMTPQQQRLYKMTDTDKMSTIQELCSPWFYTILKIRPKQYLHKMRCPVLAIGGNKDLQVEASSNLALIRDYLPKNALHQFSEIESANHLLQICKTGNVKEYGEIEQTIAPTVLTTIATWLNKVVPNCKDR